MRRAPASPLLALLLGHWLVSACGRAPAPEAQIEPLVAPGSFADAELLLRRFTAHPVDPALAGSLQPTTADYAAAFTPDVAAELEAAQRALWSGGPLIAPAAGETEVRLVEATSEELQRGVEVFPGFTPILTALRPGIVWYRFKFVRPGGTVGTRGDGLTYINGRWALFPEPGKHAALTPDKALCDRFTEHVFRLVIGAQPNDDIQRMMPMFEEMRGEVVKKCMDAERRIIACALAAKTIEDITRCDPGHKLKL